MKEVIVGSKSNGREQPAEKMTTKAQDLMGRVSSTFFEVMWKWRENFCGGGLITPYRPLMRFLILSLPTKCLDER